MYLCVEACYVYAMHVWICSETRTGVGSPGAGAGSPGAGGVDGCKPLDVGTGNQAQVL